MMEKIAKMAKESEEEKNRSERYEEGRKEYFKRAQEMYEDAERKETKEEYFRRLMKRSTSLDKVLEFLKFRKQADKLLPQMEEEIVKLVRKELEIDIAVENLNLEANIASEEGTPLLEALGAKLGTSFANIIVPPTKKCILCQSALTKHNEPSVVALFTLSGPVVAAKHTWRCRQCKNSHHLQQQTLSPTEEMEVAEARDVHYEPDSYGNSQVHFTIFEWISREKNPCINMIDFRRATDFMLRDLTSKSCPPVQKCSLTQSL